MLKESTEWEVKSIFRENLGSDGYIYGFGIDGFTGEVYLFSNSHLFSHTAPTPTTLSSYHLQGHSYKNKRFTYFDLKGYWK